MPILFSSSDNEFCYTVLRLSLFSTIDSLQFSENGAYLIAAGQSVHMINMDDLSTQELSIPNASVVQI